MKSPGTQQVLSGFRLTSSSHYPALSSLCTLTFLTFLSIVYYDLRMSFYGHVSWLGSVEWNDTELVCWFFFRKITLAFSVQDGLAGEQLEAMATGKE